MGVVFSLIHRASTAFDVGGDTWCTVAPRLDRRQVRLKSTHSSCFYLLCPVRYATCFVSYKCLSFWSPPFTDAQQHR